MYQATHTSGLRRALDLIEGLDELDRHHMPMESRVERIHHQIVPQEAQKLALCILGLLRVVVKAVHSADIVV